MTGLNQLQFATSQVAIMQDELRRLQPQLVDTSTETECLMVKIEQDTVEVEAQKEVQFIVVVCRSRMIVITIGFMKGIRRR